MGASVAGASVGASVMGASVAGASVAGASVAAGAQAVNIRLAITSSESKASKRFIFLLQIVFVDSLYLYQTGMTTKWTTLFFVSITSFG
jgi:hypothetical protein